MVSPMNWGAFFLTLGITYLLLAAVSKDSTNFYACLFWSGVIAIGMGLLV